MDINQATKYDPDELVTITNNKTKQVKQIKRKQLTEFGLPIDYISQADTYANSVKTGTINPDQVPETYLNAILLPLNEPIL